MLYGSSCGGVVLGVVLSLVGTLEGEEVGGVTWPFVAEDVSPLKSISVESRDGEKVNWFHGQGR